MKNTMYLESKGRTWNPFVGCYHDCIYCKPSYQRQMKRRWSPDPAKRNNIKGSCKLCYDYIPHLHPERLGRGYHLPQTRGREFIFCCDMGDISFARPEWVKAILQRIEDYGDRPFLLQSKDPICFWQHYFPRNVILGTTIETNRNEEYEKYGISKAPLPSERYRAMRDLGHSWKIVTVEPILDFDVDILTNWLREIHPHVVYVGYENHGVTEKLNLPEPSIQKVEDFIAQLTDFTKVRTKTLRKAYWEE